MPDRKKSYRITLVVESDDENYVRNLAQRYIGMAYTDTRVKLQVWSFEKRGRSSKNEVLVLDVVKCKKQPGG